MEKKGIGTAQGLAELSHLLCAKLTARGWTYGRLAVEVNLLLPPNYEGAAVGKQQVHALLSRPRRPLYNLPLFWAVCKALGVGVGEALRSLGVPGEDL